MFRKLISNLPFSPSLVGQLGFYAKRLKKEEATRRLGLIVTALALAVQSFAVFAPPESANASNVSDFIRGGVGSGSEILEAYDKSARGNGDFKDLVDYAGLTRTDLAGVTLETLNSQSAGKGSNAWQTWSRVPLFNASQGEVKHVVPKNAGGTTTVYSKPLWLYDTSSWSSQNGTNYAAFVGYSKKIGKFAIHKNSGNLITTTTPKLAPGGSFTEATCQYIRGTVVGVQNNNQAIRSYLYFRGPPGVGERVGPVSTDSDNLSFSYRVPEKYQTSATPTKVWGIAVPLAGWDDGSVQFKNTVTVPGGCTKSRTAPVVTCDALRGRLIEKTKYSLAARTSIENGAKVTGYEFTVKDSTGKIVQANTINSSAAEIDSGIMTLAIPDVYRAAVKVMTSVGDKESAECTTTLIATAPAVCSAEPGKSQSNPQCQPCADNQQSWYKAAACNPAVAQSKEAKNLTQNTDSTTIVAQASDRIEYTVYVENVGEIPANTSIVEQLTDVMEYAALQDNGGGTYSPETKTLSWDGIVLQPGEKAARSFVIRVNDTIATTPQGTSEPGSYDCIMTSAFGNTINIRVNCEIPKVLEQTVSELPKTGPGANTVFAGILATLVTYFWARSRQMGREVQLIRKEFNSGTL